MKKVPTGSEKEGNSELNLLFHFKAREKKTQPGFNSLSCLQAREKEVHPDPNSLSHFNAREKKTREGFARSLVFKLMKKRSTGPLFLIFVYERHQSHYASAFDSCCYFTLVLR